MTNVMVVGSPVCEVYDGMKEKFAASTILAELGLTPGNFFTASKTTLMRFGGSGEYPSTLAFCCPAHAKYNMNLPSTAPLSGFNPVVGVIM